MPMLTGHRATFAQPLVATSKSPYLMQELAPGSISGRYFVGLRAMLSAYERANWRAGTFVIYFVAIAETESLTSRKCRCSPRSPLSAASPHLNTRIHFGFYRALFDARATNSSNLGSSSFRTGD